MKMDRLCLTYGQPQDLYFNSIVTWQLDRKRKVGRNNLEKKKGKPKYHDDRDHDGPKRSRDKHKAKLERDKYMIII